MARIQIEMGMSNTRAPIQAGIEIRIRDVDLAAKLDALGAAIAAVREAHRDTISTCGWAALHRAQEAIAEAMMDAPRHDRLTAGQTCLARSASVASL